MKLKIEANERTTLVGKTGSGKTYLAERLVLPSNRLIVLDPKNTLSRWGLDDYDRSARRDLLQGRAVRARFSPEPGDTDGYERVMMDVYDVGNCLLYIDEVYGIVEGSKAGTYFTALYTRGRELGVGVVAATQRPVWLPLFVFSEAGTYFCFRLMLDADRKRMSEFMGDNVLEHIPDPHGFYVYQTSWARNNAVYYKSIQG